MKTLKNILSIQRGKILAAVLLWLGLSMPASALVTYVNSSLDSVGGGGSSSVTLALPGGTTVSDVLVAQIGLRATAPTITPPTGWSLIQSRTRGEVTLAVYYKVAGAMEPASYTWMFDATYRLSAALSTFRGVDTVAPIMASTSAVGTGSSVTASSVTTTAVDAMLVDFFSIRNGGATFSQPAGMTEFIEWGGGAGPNGIGLAADYESRPATGATGARTAVASVSADWVSISLALRASTALDHIRLEHTGSGLTCTPSSVTVKACADAACTTLYTGGTTTVTLAPASGWATNPISFTGSTTASLSVITPSTVTLGTSAASPTPSGTSPQCYVGATATCSHTFADTGFIFSSIPTQVAGTTSDNITIQAVKKSDSSAACTGLFTGNKTIDMASQCINPATCAGRQVTINATAIANNPASGISSYTEVTLNFGANSTATFTLNYPDVGAMSLSARYLLGGSDYMTGTSNTFVVKPFGFTVTNIQRTSDSFANPAAADATGTAFIKAGSSFTATVTAIANGGAATPNYGRETAPEGVLLTPNIVLPAAGINPALANGTIAGGSFSSGVATPTNLAWNEVGIITLTPSVADASYLGVGDVTGTTTGNVGRFYPDHFALSSGSITTRTDISPACSPASTFTYMGEPFQAGFTLTAKGPSPGNVTLQNYVNGGTAATNFAKLATATPIPAGFGMAYLDGTTNLTTRVDSSLGITGTWTGGVLAATATLGFTRDTAPDGPYNAMKVGIAPVDSDGVALNVFDMDVTAPPGNDHAEVGQTQIRFGRLRLSNAHGSELLALPIPISLQYWNGTLFTTHTADSCTGLTSANIGLDNYKNNLASGETSISPATINFASGIGTMRLTAPGVGNSGSVDVCVDLGADPAGGVTCSAAASAGKSYLQGKWAPGTAWDNDPKVRATFGVYKNANEFIYLREMY